MDRSPDGASPTLPAIDTTTGALDTSVDIRPNSAVNAILTGPNVTYLGGAFTKVNGQDRRHLAAINPDGTLNDTWTPTTDAGDCPSQYYNSNTCSNGGTGRSGAWPCPRTASPSSSAVSITT